MKNIILKDCMFSIGTFFYNFKKRKNLKSTIKNYFILEKRTTLIHFGIKYMMNCYNDDKVHFYHRKHNLIIGSQNIPNINLTDDTLCWLDRYFCEYPVLHYPLSHRDPDSISEKQCCYDVCVKINSNSNPNQPSCIGGFKKQNKNKAIRTYYTYFNKIKNLPCLASCPQIDYSYSLTHLFRIYIKLNFTKNPFKYQYIRFTHKFRKYNLY